MRLKWLLAYLRMCNYSCDVVACDSHTGEVIRAAPLDCFGIRGTALFVQAFDYSPEVIVVYLAQTTTFLTSSVKIFNFDPGHPEVIEFIENPVR